MLKVERLDCSLLTEDFYDPRLQTQVEADTLGAALLVAAAQAGEHAVVGLPRGVVTNLQWQHVLQNVTNINYVSVTLN